MNGSVHRQRPNSNKRLFDGRLEKRLTMSVPVYLASLGETRASERTVTENVSPHGARVISKRSWRSGEEALIAPLTGEFPQVETVVYFPAQKRGRALLPGCRIPGSLGQMGELLRTRAQEDLDLAQRRQRN